MGTSSRSFLTGTPDPMVIWLPEDDVYTVDEAQNRSYINVARGMTGNDNRS